MARTVGIGLQSFEKLINNQYFYIDKTNFIREWWASGDEVTLITRPRRFGKTLNMNMLECFFSIQYSDKAELFENLSIWKEENYRNIQGTYPVIFLSFADIKASSMKSAREGIMAVIKEVYKAHSYLLKGDILDEMEKQTFYTFGQSMNGKKDLWDKITDTSLTRALKLLMSYMERYYGQKVLVFLDEYDTPLQEAYIYGYWNELAGFIRSLFNSTFKTNQHLERALLTGITRISKESIFSDVNHMEVVTTTSEKYEDSFGFTEEEVWEALKEYGLYGERQKVKDWYDGFTFGKRQDIYNPWSILNFLDKKKISAYWANTSSNGLVDRLLRRSNRIVKMDMEDLLKGGILRTRIDEQIIFNQLDKQIDAVWSLLLACGYLRVKSYTVDEIWGRATYEFVLTNREVRLMFSQMIEHWFKGFIPEYNDFIRAMLAKDVKSMNIYMNKVALATFSYFDSGKRPSENAEPERFFHGFVLGLLVDLADRYAITSNRESGFGRYDVMLEPIQAENDAIILEFKVQDPDEEITLEDTAKAALKQIEDKGYAASLLSKGFTKRQIQTYGFAFRGKQVLIKSGTSTM